MGNTGNVYRNIENVFKNHITEKKYIAIHIDIELLSSPMLTQEWKLRGVDGSDLLHLWFDHCSESDPNLVFKKKKT